MPLKGPLEALQRSFKSPLKAPYSHLKRILRGPLTMAIIYTGSLIDAISEAAVGIIRDDCAKRNVKQHSPPMPLRGFLKAP